ncbi:hypothetical protein PHYPSEUDO_003956 [Phytophthora pseudosyringae]|uniref:Protein kinase domain-containing protein n=1 Tax=Phytophthora pseudosyringae TaxID=221518 RepID=A0A8T1VSQ8_9STRA|nr:hypothetical protein PHYPSEUDO_003956 [Phytophthora pseudosyringae]
MRPSLLTLLFVVTLIGDGAADSTYAVYALYAGGSCTGTPYAVYALEESCTDGDEVVACSSYDGSVGADNVGQWYATCATDYISAMRSMFSNSHYILEVGFNDTSCSEFYAGYGVPASGNCEGSLNETSEYYILGTLDVTGVTSIQYFSGAQCSTDSLYATDEVDATALASHTCSNGMVWYSSEDDLGSSSGGGDSSTGLSTGAVVGIICGCVVLVLVLVGAAVLYRRWSKRKHAGQYTTTLDATSLEAAMSGQSGLWNDDVITAKRIPRDKVKIKKLISRGAYGEVYNGVFNGQQVAVKMLLPATRGNLQHVTGFLTEAKMTASMDHPHIVTFIGVAWDSLSDLCVVLEFMDAGDLRSLLNNGLLSSSCQTRWIDLGESVALHGYNFRRRTTFAPTSGHAGDEGSLLEAWSLDAGFGTLHENGSASASPTNVQAAEEICRSWSTNGK